jgi:hypothetical protein
MTRTFSDLSFQSDEAETIRSRIRAKFTEEFAAIEAVVRLAISELSSVKGVFNPNYLVGTAFWLRCIETCQGTVLLAERGMTTAPSGVLRTAFECLFTACAVWRKPDLVAKLEQHHHFERIQQAKKMADFKTTLGGSKEQIELLEEVANLPKVEKVWSAFDAAVAADFKQLYEVVYRGLALGGAHASPRSLDDFWSDAEDGAVTLGLEPSERRVVWYLSLVRTCLTNGIERHRDALKVEGNRPS